MARAAKGSPSARLVTDADVPGLVVPSSAVAKTVEIGDHCFEMLEDGTVFVSQWRGDSMVSHALFELEDVAALRGLLR